MPTRPLLLGHRGARAEKSIPENTLASFDCALAQGCDGFEFDVRLSADEQPVICHDVRIHGFEIAQTSSNQLALPTLRDVLKRYQSSAFLDIELKVLGLEAITLKLLRTYPPARGYVVSSFLPEVLQVMHGMDATIPLGLICETRAQFGLWSQLPVQYVISQHNLARQNVITKVKDSGKKLYVWTVNSTTDIRRLADRGVDGIISDHPKRLARVFGASIEAQK
ncbi:MAG TPA: glycerophosphodiester phosphodiesterase [Candidatus Sulfotelmatobacter sp.]|nr:glycerophosphodiester phosphodiesterase [Candidatus Sulfotelmatobacter sp.]